MTRQGIVKYNSGITYNLLQEAFRSVLRHVSGRKGIFSIPYHKNAKNELFLSFVLPIKREYRIQKDTYFEFSEALKKAFALHTIKRRQTTTNYDKLRLFKNYIFPKFSEVFRSFKGNEVTKSHILKEFMIFVTAENRTENIENSLNYK